TDDGGKLRVTFEVLVHPRLLSGSSSILKLQGQQISQERRLRFVINFFQIGIEKRFGAGSKLQGECFAEGQDPFERGGRKAQRVGRIVRHGTMDAGLEECPSCRYKISSRRGMPRVTPVDTTQDPARTAILGPVICLLNSATQHAGQAHHPGMLANIPAVAMSRCSILFRETWNPSFRQRMSGGDLPPGRTSHWPGYMHPLELFFRQPRPYSPFRKSFG